MNIKKYLVGPMAICLLIIAIGCGQKPKENKNIEQDVDALALSVKLGEVVIGRVEQVLHFSGAVRGEKEVRLFAKVPGKLATKVKQEGDSVRKGQAIAYIDRDEEGLKYSRAPLESPIDGIVTEYFADLGDSVFPAQMMQPVASVAQIENVKVTVGVSASDIGRIRKGQSVRITVDVFPDREFSGRVTSVSPAADPVSRKFKVEITIPNAESRLKPGFFARIEVVTTFRNNVLVVPRSAIVVRDGEDVVFIAEDGKAKTRGIKVGIKGEDKVEITSGLKVGEQVIVEGNYALTDGTRVEVQQ